MTAVFQPTEGRARFHDGMWEPQAPPTIKEMAERAGAGGDGSTLIFQYPVEPGHRFEMHEKSDALGNKTMHLFHVRSGATPINPKGPMTTDDANAMKAKAAYQAEIAHNNSNAARIAAFWAKRA